MELPIQESSPASEMIDSLGSSTNSSTGMVVPVMRACMGGLGGKYTSSDSARFLHRETLFDVTSSLASCCSQLLRWGWRGSTNCAGCQMPEVPDPPLLRRA